MPEKSPGMTCQGLRHRCFNCGGQGHRGHQCTSRRSEENTQAIKPTAQFRSSPPKNKSSTRKGTQRPSFNRRQATSGRVFALEADGDVIEEMIPEHDEETFNEEDH